MNQLIKQIEIRDYDDEYEQKRKEFDRDPNAVCHRHPTQVFIPYLGFNTHDRKKKQTSIRE